jgi:ribosomal protein S6
MNRELEAIILAYEKASASRDKEAEHYLLAFESLLDSVMERQPNLSRDILRKSVIKAHRKWALKQDSKTSSDSPKSVTGVFCSVTS